MEGAFFSLLIGLLFGLERERSKHAEALFAGIRTFPLLSLSGYLAGLAGGRGMPWVLPVVLLVVGGFGVASYVRGREAEAGVTTEVSTLLATLLGASVAWGLTPLAVSLAVIATLLLTLKSPLHRLAGAVTQDEILAILKFGVVAAVLLPLLPDEPMGPYGALVPRTVGIVVVLLSGVSLAGYLMVRVLGARAGWALAGLLGGLVSSTATTLSFSGKAREVLSRVVGEDGVSGDHPGTDGLPAVSRGAAATQGGHFVRHLAMGIVLASTVLYARGAFLFGLLDHAMLDHLAPRLGILAMIGLVFAAIHFHRGEKEGPESVSLGNPVELGRAVSLALVFAAVIVLARAAQARMGAAGLWSVGFLGGLVDVDSVAVAMARLRQQNLASVETASGAYLLATLANLAFKGGAVWVVGGAPLARKVLPAFVSLAAATGILLLLG